MGIVGNFLASKSAEFYRGAFEQQYRKVIGTNPPQAASDACYDAVMAARAYAGTGNEGKVLVKIDNATSRYASAVCYSSMKMQVYFACIIASISDPKTGEICRGYECAAATVFVLLEKYCPDAL